MCLSVVIPYDIYTYVYVISSIAVYLLSFLKKNPSRKGVTLVVSYYFIKCILATLWGLLRGMTSKDR